MPIVLIMNQSAVICNHGGQVNAIGSAKLRVNGQAVLLQDDIEKAAVSGCTLVNSSNSTQCIKVTGVTSGQATKLAVGGKPVMLDTTFIGTTNGFPPPGLLSAIGIQSKLTAI